MNIFYIIIIIYSVVFGNVNTDCSPVPGPVIICNSLDIHEEWWSFGRTNAHAQFLCQDNELPLPKHLFRYKSLDTIGFAGCKINTIYPDTFTDLEMRWLMFQYTKTETIYAGAFKNIKFMRKIEISNNQLKFIPFGVFTKLPIEILDLSFNRITRIEDRALQKLPNLEDLYLNNNQLSYIVVHKMLDHPEHLKALKLNNNLLSILTLHMLKGLVNLKSLDIGNNQIQFLEPGAFEQTAQLQILNVTNNRIKEISDLAFPGQGLNYLNELYLDHNELMFLPYNFLSQMKNLRQIKIVGNPWLCPCLFDFSTYLYVNRVKEVCQSGYNSGVKPICVNDPLQTNCSRKYNYELGSGYLEARNSINLTSQEEGH